MPRFSLFSSEWGSQICIESGEKSEYLESTTWHESSQPEIFVNTFQKQEDCTGFETRTTSNQLKQSEERATGTSISPVSSIQSDSTSWMEESDPTRESKVNTNEDKGANLEPILQILEEVPYEYTECTRNTSESFSNLAGNTDITLDSQVPFEHTWSDCEKFSIRSGSADITLHSWVPFEYRKTDCEHYPTSPSFTAVTQNSQMFLAKKSYGGFHYDTNPEIHNVLRVPHEYDRSKFEHFSPSFRNADLTLPRQALYEYSRNEGEYFATTALFQKPHGHGYSRRRWGHRSNSDEYEYARRTWRSSEQYYRFNPDLYFHGKSLEDLYYDEVNNPARFTERKLTNFPNWKAQIQSPDGDNQDATRNRWKGKELLLTLRPDQVAQGIDIEHLRTQFKGFGYDVSIHFLEEKPDCYRLEFNDRREAQRALADPEIGYKLVKKRPPRPSPSCPIQFKALDDLRIRSGKALTGKVVGEVKKNELVTVNQVKGRRARLMVIDKGRTYNRGWVSVHTSEGKPLLERQEKCHGDTR
jgi:hypothetical protein